MTTNRAPGSDVVQLLDEELYITGMPTVHRNTASCRWCPKICQRLQKESQVIATQAVRAHINAIQSERHEETQA
jgi:hypothetical protein